MHEPVLLTEFLSFFEGRSLKTFVDCTLGAGGHAKALLDHHPELQRFYGFDQDREALEIAKNNLAPYKEKLILNRCNFRLLSERVKERVDGIFIDLGVSSMQLDRGEKGFSFLKEGPLDMRMDDTAPLDAATLVNTASEKELADIFWEYGEERRSRIAAKAIVEGRKKRKIVTTQDFVALLMPVMPRREKKHPLTRVFQALRIVVNDELGVIRSVIPQALSLLAPGGRLGILSFHSLEDRIVKESFKAAFKEGRILLLTKKPLAATRQEVLKNRRSRSAKLRFCEIIE